MVSSRSTQVQWTLHIQLFFLSNHLDKISVITCFHRNRDGKIWNNKFPKHASYGRDRNRDNFSWIYAGRIQRPNGFIRKAYRNRYNENHMALEIVLIVYQLEYIEYTCIVNELNKRLNSERIFLE